MKRNGFYEPVPTRTNRDEDPESDQEDPEREDPDEQLTPIDIEIVLPTLSLDERRKDFAYEEDDEGDLL